MASPVTPSTEVGKGTRTLLSPLISFQNPLLSPSANLLASDSLRREASLSLIYLSANLNLAFEVRCQYVCINDTSSECIKVTCGVPQGSILCPALFIVYINDMCNVSMLMKSIVFADDTNFFYSGDNLSQVCETVSTELDKLHSWFQVNKLSLTIGKTNFMIFGNKQCEDNHVVSINGMNIKRVYVTKFLGVHIYSHLNWGEHINHIKSKISKKYVYNAKSYAFNSALYSLYSTLVMPYLNYCCEIWGNTYKSRIQPMHIIQNRSIRICQRADYRSHSRPFFYQVKILNVHDMVNFKCMVYVQDI